MESCGVGGEGEGRKRGRLKDGETGGEPDPKRRMATTALTPWAPPHHPASRIYRVSRASGGKDRHSKVYTAKGIRDRRVRLSVATAIQFYDLQDRLGYDQPSKAIEWLIKAAADAIDKLPSLDAVSAGGFPSHPASAPPAGAAASKDGDKDGDGVEDDDQGKQQRSGGSGCSSTSETSKGSVLSLSRNESRVKARERARERSAATTTTRDKDDGGAGRRAAAPGTTNTNSAASSFTELLTGMAAVAAAAEHKQQQTPPATAAWTTPMLTTADYIGFAQAQQPSRKSAGHHTISPTFASPAPHLSGHITPAQQLHFNGLSAAAGAVTVASGGGEQAHAAEMTQQHFAFLQGDHFMPVVHAAAPANPAAAGGDYNLNFSMSSGGLVGVNSSSRGTLQSNSPHISAHHHHHHHHLQLDAPSNIPFLFAPAAAAAPTAAETQFAAFQLWNGFHHHHAADMKEKGKN